MRKKKWFCNACTSSYENNFSYYCYECDFDLCENCFKLSKSKTPKNYDHPHQLSVKELTKNLFICDNCKSRYDRETIRFRCNRCDFDLCFKCRYL